MFEFDTRLRTLRQHFKLSLGQLAEQTGIPKATLSRWEAGKSRPSIGNKYLQKLTEFYKVPLSTLIDGDGV